MKLTLLLLAFLSMSCKRNDFDLDNPNPVKFVEQLKDRTYNKYEFGENGEKLWAKMPLFTKEHISKLIELSADTSSICPSEHFPINPLSSMRPYREIDGKACIMIAEYILWCVEGIIKQATYASLNPVLIKSPNLPSDRLSGKEILEVRKLYLIWLEEYHKTGTLGDSPLKGTNYIWM